ncbi:MAG: NF038122 family metalloprotease [Caulobacteraceae bacterium]|nr:NF038122 family metalloprotease [Caulobacteraceae bacterium]
MTGISSLPTGFVINPIYDASVLASPSAAQFEAAVAAQIAVIERTYSSSVTLNLHIGLGEVGGQAIPATLGAASLIPTHNAYDYNTVARALVGRPYTIPVLANDLGMTLTLANTEAMALGLEPNAPVDGYIGFSNAIAWDYSAGPTIAAFAYDFQANLYHEITHQMGRVTVASPIPPWLLDRFRYVSPGQGDVTHYYTSDYFSIDGGVTRGYTFESTGDFSDWAASNPPDAFGETNPGVYQPVSQIDLQVMSAIGWNLTASTDFSETIKSYYDAFFGRDPTAEEAAEWQHLLSGGTALARLRSALLNDPTGQAHTNAQIKLLYDTYFGRDPQASEVSAWQGLIASAYDFTGMRAALIAAPEGQAHTNSAITSLYDTYMGRNPSASELGVWQSLVVGGDDFTALRATLLASPEGQTHTIAAITALYDIYMGRDPSASELGVWQGLVAGGDDYAAVRTTLLASAEGQTHTIAAVTALYDSYMGRDPSASELGVWQGLIAGGADFSAARTAILGSGEGASHTLAEVTDLYDTYMGRNPTASELGVWQALVAGGDDFSRVRTAILGSSEGQTHTTSAVTNAYDAYFGRDPTASELGVWSGLVAGGDGFALLDDTLLRDIGSAAMVPRLDATGASSLAIATGPPAADVLNFNAASSTLLLSAAQFGGIDPLDGAHASQVVSAGGQTDTLIVLSASNAILIENTPLGSLSANNFAFG